MLKKIYVALFFYSSVMNAGEFVSFCKVAGITAGTVIISDASVNVALLSSNKIPFYRKIVGSVENALRNPFYGISLGLGLGLAARVSNFTDIYRLTLSLAGVAGLATAKSMVDLCRSQKCVDVQRKILNNHHWIMGVGFVGLGLFIVQKSPERTALNHLVGNLGERAVDGALSQLPMSGSIRQIIFGN